MARTFKMRTVAYQFREVESAYDVPEDWPKNVTINGPEDMARFSFLFDNQAAELFYVFALDAGNRVRGFVEVTRGIASASLIHPREVFVAALAFVPCALILAHNHPSGRTEPSEDDRNITRQIASAGKILGIPVHDHIIYGEGETYSFAEHGLMIAA